MVDEEPTTATEDTPEPDAEEAVVAMSWGLRARGLRARLRSGWAGGGILSNLMNAFGIGRDRMALNSTSGTSDERADERG